MVCGSIRRRYAIKNIRNPANVTKFHSFLGLTGYHRRFIKKINGKAAVMHAVTSKKYKFGSGEAEGESFKTLKKAPASPSVLAFVDFDKPLMVETDA